MEHTVDNFIQKPLNNLDGHTKYNKSSSTIFNKNIHLLPSSAKMKKGQSANIEYLVYLMISGGEELTAAV